MIRKQRREKNERWTTASRPEQARVGQVVREYETHQDVLIRASGSNKIHTRAREKKIFEKGV